MSDVDTIEKIDEEIREVTNEPGRYKVVFINDNHTPMEWVVDVLTRIFKHTVESAAEITMQIHTEGSGIAGVYSFEVAEQKAFETVKQSREHGFPLQVKLDEE